MSGVSDVNVHCPMLPGEHDDSVQVAGHLGEFFDRKEPSKQEFHSNRLPLYNVLLLQGLFQHSRSHCVEM